MGKYIDPEKKEKDANCDKGGEGVCSSAVWLVAQTPRGERGKTDHLYIEVEMPST